jgi:dTMP kinase
MDNNGLEMAPHQKCRAIRRENSTGSSPANTRPIRHGIILQLSAPCFITLEGIEGCGKTAQATLLEQHLSDIEVPHLMTKEPGGTLFGKALREILLREDNVSREPVSELLLYLADRCQHLIEVVEPAMNEGKVVISDRYHDATLAYQGFARGVKVSLIQSLAQDLNFRTPDLTLFLDLPVKIGLQRARKRNCLEGQTEFGRFESEMMEFHEKVRQGYIELMNEDPQRFLRIDACGRRREVFERVRDTLEQRGLSRK